jgi:hypothetical protein
MKNQRTILAAMAIATFAATVSGTVTAALAYDHVLDHVESLGLGKRYWYKEGFGKPTTAVITHNHLGNGVEELIIEDRKSNMRCTLRCGPATGGLWTTYKLEKIHH